MTAYLPPARSLFVMMDLSTRCNLRCRMCPRHLAQPEPRDVAPDLLQRIAEQVFPRAAAVSLSCGAEPLMARRFDEALTLAAASGVPHVDFVTNGTLLDERRIRLSIAAGLRRVMVSVDGATAETYEAIRTGARFERVIENLRLLKRLKYQAGTPYPRLRLHFVLMRSNVAELPRFLELARELGAAEVDVRHLAVYAGLGMEDEALSRQPKAANAALRQARWQAARSGIALHAPPPFPDTDEQGWIGTAGTKLGLAASAAANAGLLLGRADARAIWHLGRRAGRRAIARPSLCRTPGDTIVLNVDGDVLPCPFWYGEAPMGNLAASDFAEVWGGPSYADLRARLRGEQPLPPACRRCPSVGSHRVSEDAFRTI